MNLSNTFKPGEKVTSYHEYASPWMRFKKLTVVEIVSPFHTTVRTSKGLIKEVHNSWLSSYSDALSGVMKFRKDRRYYNLLRRFTV